MDGASTISADTGCVTQIAQTLSASLNVTSDKAITLATTLCGTIQSAATQAAESTTASLDVAGIRGGLNTTFLLFSGSLAFVMHAGFAMLCAGAIRSKNTMNILLQTVLDACVCAIAFYVVGFGFAYGEGEYSNRFIGNAVFGLHKYVTNWTGAGEGRWTEWFFAYAFAATAATIPAGAVAERFNFNAYLGYSAIVSAFVYPVVAHWVWSRQGWLTYASSTALGVRGPHSFLFKSGMMDYAGSGVVHLTGALTGFVGCVLVGPRLGRFDSDGKPCEMPGHSAVLSVLGTVLLWFGWYGFNPGSILTVDTAVTFTVAARSAVCTTLSGAAGGITSLALAFVNHKAWDLMSLCNGALVGFVSVTAGAHVIEPWAAVIVGSVGAVIFEAARRTLLRLQIDDPLDAFPMHGVCGMWAVFYTGLLAKEEYVAQAYGNAPYHGLFYGGGGNLLACQVVGLLAIIAWVVGLMGPFFWILRYFGKLRIPPEQEHLGLDVSHHGGTAYHLEAAHNAGIMDYRRPPPTSLKMRINNDRSAHNFYDRPTYPNKGVVVVNQVGSFSHHAPQHHPKGPVISPDRSKHDLIANAPTPNQLSRPGSVNDLTVVNVPVQQKATATPDGSRHKGSGVEDAVAEQTVVDINVSTPKAGANQTDNATADGSHHSGEREGSPDVSQRSSSTASVNPLFDAGRADSPALCDALSQENIDVATPLSVSSSSDDGDELMNTSHDPIRFHVSSPLETIPETSSAKV